MSGPRTVPKHRTGIPGFDLISDGGLPRARATLVAGTAGSAKTVFATQFLAAGILNDDEPGVFVTFEDRVGGHPREHAGLRLGHRRVGGSRASGCSSTPRPTRRSRTSVVGAFDLERPAVAHRARGEEDRRPPGLARLAQRAVRRSSPTSRSCAPSCSASPPTLKSLGVTVVFTAERIDEYGEVTRHGIEEFVADNVIILRNLLDDERRRRTIEILKFRGTPHQKGEFPFTITRATGIVVIPLVGDRAHADVDHAAHHLGQTRARRDVRRRLLPRLDHPRLGRDRHRQDAARHAVHRRRHRAGERCLLFAFEESRDQLFRNAAGWGFDFEQLEKDGRLKVVNRLSRRDAAGGPPHPR